MVKHSDADDESLDADLDYLRRLKPGYDAGAVAGPVAGDGADPEAGPDAGWDGRYGAVPTDAELGAPDVPLAAETTTVLLAAEPASDVDREWVTCPECGEASMIDPAQRRAEDFCPNCDFPLFWARAAVVAMAGDATGASLRRLPGTVGRAATASVACPHCGEPNSPVAINCVRCGRPMVVEPEPEPVYVAPEPEPVYEEPEPEPEPERGFPVWLVIAICMAIVVAAVAATLVLQYG